MKLSFPVRTPPDLDPTELGITIAGELFEHLLCHCVLPYSNWEWATACLSESLLALRRGVQSAMFRLGRAPDYHQTDHSTAATHAVGSQRREFNAEYEAVMRHLGMKPRTIRVGAKEVCHEDPLVGPRRRQSLDRWRVNFGRVLFEPELLSLPDTLPEAPWQQDRSGPDLINLVSARARGSPVALTE